MRWPDIFFRARKRREEPLAPSKPSPDAATKADSAVPQAIKPALGASDAKAKDKPEEPARPAISGTAPALRPAVRATKPVVLGTTTAPTPIPTETDPLKVFAKANSLRLAKRAETVSSPESTTIRPTETPAATSPSTEALPPAKDRLAEDKPTTPVAEEASVPETATAAGSTTLRRKAKMTDVARIISPSESTEPEPLPEPPSAVTPPAFNVAVPVGSVTQPDKPNSNEKPVTSDETKPVESAPATEPAAQETPASPVPAGPAPAPPEPEKKAEAPIAEKPPEPPTAPPEPAPSPTPETPAQKPEPTPHDSVPFEHLPAKAAEKKEFLLVNGERILGNVLSETPDIIYLDHDTLGVLTLPRSQIAARPVEIILINGDRIVGDIMAETPDTLYVRHASLGMLTVPRAQRSTRVVEAILKDGDRIIGEVLAETENFTVIRSATLGTVPVPHNKVAMLNRKAEQVTLKALPTQTPAIEDKPKT